MFSKFIDYITYCVQFFKDIIVYISLLAQCLGGGLERDNLFHLLSQFFMYLFVYVYV